MEAQIAVGIFRQVFQQLFHAPLPLEQPPPIPKSIRCFNAAPDVLEVPPTLHFGDLRANLALLRSLPPRCSHVQCAGAILCPRTLNLTASWQEGAKKHEVRERIAEVRRGRDLEDVWGSVKAAHALWDDGGCSSGRGAWKSCWNT